MSCRKQLEIRSEDRTSPKWCVSLREDTFDSFISKGTPTVQKVFGVGSLFSPLLFGKFFDPSDAFPLWEFESEVLLSGLRDSDQSTVDWFETNKEYVLKAELPGVGKSKNNTQVYVENGKVVEISGLWRQRRETEAKDWRSSYWWESGYTRRLELSENADWKKIEAYIDDDIFLEIRIPKKIIEVDLGISQGNNGASKDSETIGINVNK